MDLEFIGVKTNKDVGILLYKIIDPNDRQIIVCLAQHRYPFTWIQFDAVVQDDGLVRVSIPMENPHNPNWQYTYDWVRERLSRSLDLAMQQYRRYTIAQAVYRHIHDDTGSAYDHKGEWPIPVGVDTHNEK